MPLHRVQLHQYRFIRFQNIVFSLLTDEQINEQTGREHKASDYQSGLVKAKEGHTLKERRLGAHFNFISH